MADETISKQRSLLDVQEALGREQEKLTEGYHVVLTAIDKVLDLQKILMSMYTLIFQLSF